MVVRQVCDQHKIKDALRHEPVENHIKHQNWDDISIRDTQPVSRSLLTVLDGPSDAKRLTFGSVRAVFSSGQNACQHGIVAVIADGDDQLWDVGKHYRAQHTPLDSSSDDTVIANIDIRAEPLFHVVCRNYGEFGRHIRNSHPEEDYSCYYGRKAPKLDW